jgi:hypothetical protein
MLRIVALATVSTVTSEIFHEELKRMPTIIRP